MAYARFIQAAHPQSGISDTQLIESWMACGFSHNAEMAFSGLLGSACAIGYYRPHLFPQLLRRVVDPAVCMGIETSEQFAAYGQWLIEQDILRGWRDFGPEAHHYFTTTITQYHAVIQALITALRDEALS